MSWPIVLVVSRRTTRKNKLIDYVGEAHLQLLVRLRVLPLIVPVVEGTLAGLPQYARQMRGLLLVEGEDIEPKRYRATGANFRYLEKTHALKDEIEIRLLRMALRRGLPILGVCRGSQLLNVVSGGTLYGDVQKEKKSRLKHIDYVHYDTYRHRIAIAPASPLAHWYQRRSLRVNSYHHQGVFRLASRFKPMAHTEDGLVEAYYDPRAEFLVGIQFHPERMLEGRRGNARLWKAFASAVKRRRKG
jgi:gamma-glutamyl-gamma-aminobutyrate hydrolase PuuD